MVKQLFNSCLKEHQLRKSDQEVLVFLLSILVQELEHLCKKEDSLLDTAQHKKEKFCNTQNPKKFICLMANLIYLKELFELTTLSSKVTMVMKRETWFSNKLLTTSTETWLKPQKLQFVKSNIQCRLVNCLQMRFICREFM